jgi:hypothetical protein
MEMVEPEGSMQIESVRDFHRHLVELSAAGIALDVGQSKVAQASVPLDRLQSRWEEWIQANPEIAPADLVASYLSQADLSSAYGSALEQWLMGNRIASLEILAIPVSHQRLRRRSYWLIGLQALFLLAAVYVAMIAVSLFLFPIFNDLQQSSFRPAGPTLMALQWVRAWLPVWGYGLPLITALGLLLLRFFGRSLQHAMGSTGDTSFALAELRDSLSAPIRLPFVSSAAVLLCGIAVIAVVYSIYGATIELLLNVLKTGASGS